VCRKGENAGGARVSSLPRLDQTPALKKPRGFKGGAERMAQKRFTVHKTFLEGALKGMTITEQTDVLFTVGKAYGGGWTGPRYKVIAVEQTEPSTPEPQANLLPAT